MQLTRNRVRFLVQSFLVLVIPLTAIVLWAHGGEDHGAPSATQAGSASGPNYLSKETQFALSVYTDIAAERSLPQSIKVFGFVSAPTSAKADIYAPIAGRISVTRSYKIGDAITKGQTLFRVQQVISGTERLALEQDLTSAEKELDEATRDLARKESLSDIVAKKDIELAQIRAASAKKRAENLRAGLGGGTKSIAVAAPISGIITSSSIVNGEYIDVSKQLMEIADPKRVWIEAQVYEADVLAASASSSATVTVPTSTSVFPAKLIAKGNTVQSESRTISFIYEVENRNNEIKLGGSAAIVIGGSETSSVVSVAKHAVISRNGRNFVIIHSTPEAFMPTEVALGKHSDDAFVEVTSGVAAGDRVATTNLNLFKQNLP
jgi:RND family efflux transporter MFP subunit